MGNVWEWCEDWYRRVYDRYAVDEATDRVIRGGSWCFPAEYCRSAIRGRSEPGYRFSYLGFRVARSSVRSGTSPAKPGSEA